MSSFEIAIVTPEGPAFIGQCVQALVPGNEGIFGVLAKHMNLISSVKPGLVTIDTDMEQPIKIVVSDGIAEVNDGNLSILVEQSIQVEEIDLELTKDELESVKQKLEKAELETQRKDLTARALFLEAMVDAKL